MKWKSVGKELPPLDKSYRCFAHVQEIVDDGAWDGYEDVYFTAHKGWRRCKDNVSVYVISWILMEELQDMLKAS